MKKLPKPPKPKEPHYGPKLHIKDIEVANPRLYYEVAMLMKLEKAVVQDMVEHVGEFIADAITSGGMETVKIPYFGKFRPREKMLKKIKDWNKINESGMKNIFTALSGKPIKQTTDETLSD